MANKIITIGNQQLTPASTISLEVYRDISMISAESLKIMYSNKYNCLICVDSDSGDTVLENSGDDTLLEVSWQANKFTIYADHTSSSFTRNELIIYKIDKLVNLKAIFNSLHNIFHWIPGERILNPEFGSKLYYLLYNGITSFTSELIVAEIKNSVTTWEPRVNIVDVINASTINDTENNTIRLDIIFTVPSLNDEQYAYSYVYNRTSEQ